MDVLCAVLVLAGSAKYQNLVELRVLNVKGIYSQARIRKANEERVSDWLYHGNRSKNKSRNFALFLASARNFMSFFDPAAHLQRDV